ncbi:MAG: hypothetical protein COA42_21815 [Alteromonadaceae bacterium]|nr:MAG: hypothetical protein COA42_21815 [Alteromonadaceae bacterium]
MKKHLIMVIFAICALSYTFFISRSISLDVHENILKFHLEPGLYNNYIEYFKNAAQQSERERTFIYLASLALILSVLATFIKLNKTAKTLREGNNSLESMVALRTAELVERNQQLSHQEEERKRAESQVLEEQSRMTAIFDIAINAIVTTDEAQTIIDFNPMAESTFGISAQQAIGHTLPSLLISSDSLDTFQQLIHRLGDEQSEVQTAKQMSHIDIMGKRDKDGSFPMKVLASKNTVAESTLITLFIEDMTDSLRMERMKKEFTSIISHELRTPMTSIQGSLGLILGGAMGEVPEDMKTLLDIAYNNGERLVLLINDILDVEKFEAGEMAFDMETLSLTRLSLRAIEEMQGYASNFKVTLMFDAPAPDIFIRGDDARLLQVFSNLVSNAIKYSPEEGWVVVKLTLMDSGAPNKQRVKVSIIDRGSGVPEAFHTTIFDKFSQADSSGSRSKGGTGLGLNIAKMLIEKHQGTIGFTSEPNAETVFFFDFPVLYTEKVEADLD